MAEPSVNTPPAQAATTAKSSSTLSPPIATRRLRKKKSDPFLELPDAALHSAHNSPLTSPAAPEESDGLVRRILLNPLLSVSFILALYIVDKRQRTYRANEHPAQGDAGAGWFRGPQPYQFAGDGTWRDESMLKTTIAGPGDDLDAAGQHQRTLSKGEQWIVRKKHRKVARVSLEDAFELRDKLVWVVGAAALGGVGALGYGAQRAVYWYL